MRILGLDTSLTATGLALIDVDPSSPHNPTGSFSAQAVTVGAPKPTKDKTKRAMVRRVNALIEQIEWVFANDELDAVGIESLAYGAKGEGAWVLPWIFGRALELVEKYDRPLTVVSTSARAKYATGKGNAAKELVLLSAVKLFPEVDISDNNQADALIVGAVTAHALGLPILPVTQYRADVVEALGS